ncbi:MAG: tetratricopeptide repeat protein, partial [Anaerolineae bacterium]
MPDIRLQDYVAEIKDLIRNVRLDEAIAHSQHILRHHPKFVEAYALLGEACLEKEMYREAIEFFQRTLGADPENLIARVGLGVIYDEQGAFPEAIWQLERAFEFVPGNAEVRRELLRLYGQYDGIDKTRLKLTRGALGRLYSRNGLYERAIGEFRAVLRQDPELPDVRVALIEALWREGRQVEAVEICLDLLDDLPNCLKANLILGEIWLRGGDEESAQQRLSVARELDPENKVAQELFGKDSPLPPEEVLIPELDVMPDEFEAAPVGALAAEVLVAEEEVEGAWEADEELPEWLRDVGVTAEEPIEELAEEEVLEAPPDESPPTEEMPEWLQEVMEEEGPPPAAEPLVADAEPQEEELVADEEEPEPLPEVESLWGPEEEPEPAGAEMPEEEMPEWLQELVGEADALSGEEPAPEAEEHAALPAAEVAEETPALEEEAPTEDEILDGLPELDKAQGAGFAALMAAKAAAEVLDRQEEAPADDEVPDWLRELDSEEVEEVAAPLPDEAPALEEEAPAGDEGPDWLRELDSTEVEEVAAPLAADLHEEAPTVEAEVISDEELPDWLRDLGVT